MNDSHKDHEHAGHSRRHRHRHGEISRKESVAMGKRGLIAALLITLSIMVAEIIGGLMSNSLALISDAGHMFTDTMAIALSLFALIFAERPATPEKTYGFFRAEILVALFNAVTLVIVAGAIIFKSYQRIISPQAVESTLMLIIAAIGLTANIIGALFLSKVRHHNMNVRSAYLHIIGDMLSSVGVIVAAAIIWFTGWTVIDALISIAIAFIILRGAISLMMESISVLMESTPRDIDIAQIKGAITAVEGVKEVHELHVWTIASGFHALSCHVLIDDILTSHSDEILRQLKEVLNHKFSIEHTTIQFECANCSDALACRFMPGEPETI